MHDERGRANAVITRCGRPAHAIPCFTAAMCFATASPPKVLGCANTSDFLDRARWSFKEAQVALTADTHRCAGLFALRRGVCVRAPCIVTVAAPDVQEPPVGRVRLGGHAAYGVGRIDGGRRHLHHPVLHQGEGPLYGVPSKRAVAVREPEGEGTGGTRCCLGRRCEGALRGTRGMGGGFGVWGGAAAQSVDPRRVCPERPHFGGPETVAAARAPGATVGTVSHL